MTSSMSQNTPDKNSHKRDINSYKRATMAHMYASTPIGTSVKHFSESLSRIDTATSSSSDEGITRKLQIQIQALAVKRKILSKKERDIKRRRFTIDSDSDRKNKRRELIDQFIKGKRKRNLVEQSEKKEVKRKRTVIQSKEIDSEWETELEKTFNEFAIGSQESTLKDDEHIKLFEDPCTPEKIRDVPMYEEIMPESPVIRSFRKRSHLISKKKDRVQHKLLPVNLLSMEIRDPEETNEDETIFHYEGNAKTPVPTRQLEKSPEQNPENVSFSDLEFPTTTNNLDQPKTYFRKTSQHLASLPKWSPIKFVNYNDFIRNLPNIPRKTKRTPLSPGKICLSGVCDRATQKWVSYKDSSDSSEEEFKNNKSKTKIGKRNAEKQQRKIRQKQNQNNQKQKRKIASRATCSKQNDMYDVYNMDDETDIEFEINGQDAKRIPFREFCRRRKQNP